MTNKIAIAIFDFDGTITKEDSMLSFLFFTFGKIKTLFGLIILSPSLIAYKCKLLPNYIAKEMLLSYFFKGMDKIKFSNFAKEFSLKHMDKILKEKALMF